MKIFRFLTTPLRSLIWLIVIAVGLYFAAPYFLPSLHLPDLSGFLDTQSYEDRRDEALQIDTVLVLENSLANQGWIQTSSHTFRRRYGYEVVREDTSGSMLSTIVGSDWAATDYVEVREFRAHVSLAVAAESATVRKDGANYVVTFPRAVVTELTLLAESPLIVSHGKNDNIPQVQRDQAQRIAGFGALREIGRELADFPTDNELRYLVNQGAASVVAPLFEKAFTAAGITMPSIYVEVHNIDWRPNDQTIWSPGQAPETAGISSKVNFVHRATDLPYIENPEVVQRLIDVPLEVITGS